jgi:hypothetical protein
VIVPGQLPLRLKRKGHRPHGYRFGTPSRIVIELVEPDDGPKGGETTGPIRRRMAARRPK